MATLVEGNVLFTRISVIPLYQAACNGTTPVRPPKYLQPTLTLATFGERYVLFAYYHRCQNDQKYQLCIAAILI